MTANEKRMEGKIILVVDDESCTKLVRCHLEAYGFVVLEAFKGQDAVEMALAHRPAVVLLELVIPGLDGMEVIRLLRGHEATREIPIMVLSHKDDEEDKIRAFDVGADDYVTKPFSPKELVVRIKAVLRRSSMADEGIRSLKIGELTIDSYKHEVLIRGKRLDFSPKEFELLKLMVENPDKVFSRAFLLENLWGYDYWGDTRTVDVHIHHLRQKLQEADGKVFIETVRGEGYKLKYIS